MLRIYLSYKKRKSQIEKYRIRLRIREMWTGPKETTINRVHLDVLPHLRPILWPTGVTLVY